MSSKRSNGKSGGSSSSSCGGGPSSHHPSSQHTRSVESSEMLSTIQITKVRSKDADSCGYHPTLSTAHY